MRRRTKSRECALQMLYQLDIGKEMTMGFLEGFWNTSADPVVDSSIREFTTMLVQGVFQNRTDIDERISRHSKNWQLHRMPIVDRNILRMGCYELLYCTDIPPKVTINEAVELAKKYSGNDSGKFVNAILDKIKEEKAS